jgi:hypothetical protein
MTLKMSKVTDVPDVELGELRVTRDPGESVIKVRAKSPLLGEYFKTISKGALEKVHFLGSEFQAWAIPPELRERMVSRNRYSFFDASNPLADDHHGSGPVISFLRHKDVASGVVVEINYPVNPNRYTNEVGAAIAAFVEDHLMPFKAGMRFWFAKE